MLMLSRRQGEEIVVAFEGVVVTVRVVEIKRNQVRVGINAPPEVSVHRREIFEKIQSEKAQTPKEKDDL